MPKLVLEGKVLKWGNSYGVRIAKGDVDRAGLRVGDAVTVTTEPPGRVDVSHIPSFDLGCIGPRHDDILHAARQEKARRSRGAS